MTSAYVRKHLSNASEYFAFFLFSQTNFAKLHSKCCKMVISVFFYNLGEFICASDCRFMYKMGNRSPKEDAGELDAWAHASNICPILRTHLLRFYLGMALQLMYFGGRTFSNVYSAHIMAIWPIYFYVSIDWSAYQRNSYL